jgi:putative NIF3 family GTP cyclohydrolase 1 type 2
MNAPLLLALALLAAAAIGCATSPSPRGTAPMSAGTDPAKAGSGRPTARQIVARIQQQVGCPWTESTVDTFKAGDPDTEVTGIAVTFLANLDVLQRAAAAGANFVITHEPTFYNHLDQINSPLDVDKVLAEKQAFIAKHKMVIWRFHDHWHRRQPDGIDEGVAGQLGWTKQLRPGDAAIFDLPERTLRSLAEELQGKLGATVVRVVGPSEMQVRQVALLPGASGSPGHIRMLQREDVQVLLVGESPEWETVEYVRDAVAAGKSKALILLGHANSEEAGMAHCAEWLRGFVREVPVRFVPAGDPFWSPTKR